jgi:hypothetical protein
MDDLVIACHAWAEPNGVGEVGVQGRERPPQAQADRSLSWPRAVVTALAVLAVLVLVFALAPDRIADALERRDVSSDGRDVVLLGWWLAAVVLVPWVLSRLQRRGLL